MTVDAVRIGNECYQRQDFATAAMFFAIALEDDPTRNALRAALIETLRRTGQLGEAIAVAKAGIDFDPDSDTPYAVMAGLYAQAGSYSKAAEFFRM
nr:tetratricopeptide repeat protein [Micromonospora sp. DSM 115978]